MNAADRYFNLDDYLTRIGYKGSLEVGLTTLKALVRHHTQSISFENIDILLGREISLEPETIFNKLVLKQQGGYCFEQNLLFCAALSELGFMVRPLGGRVRIGTTDRQHRPGRTHLFLLVHLGDRDWLVDVGFGSYSLTEVLLLEANSIQPTPHGPRRLQRVQDRWFHQGKEGGQWADLYEFDLSPMYDSDQRVANWYTQSSPWSHFTYRLSVARALPSGGRLALRNRRLRRVEGTGAEQISTLESLDELAQVLHEDFLLSRQSDVQALWNWLLNESDE